MAFCSKCGTKLEIGDRFCPDCGEAVTRKRQSEVSTLADSQSTGQSTEDAVRRGMTNAKFNEEMSNVLGYEVSFIAISIGLLTKSWWWGGGTFLALLILTMIPSTGKILCVILGLAWGVIGYFVGEFFFGADAGWVIGIILGICGIGANLAGRQHFEDIGN